MTATDPTAGLFADPDEVTVEALLDLFDAERARLAEVLVEAIDGQWRTSPVPKPREDTTERSKGGPPGNPTADTALDVRRLRLRAQVVASERALRTAAAQFRAVRLGLERALCTWQGEE